MDKEIFASRLLDWYGIHGRSLPWRGVNDPYAVLVSEYMAQQTRVDTVIPYYLRWMQQFPTLQALAGAPQETVLKAWEGLGYYARARNLHKAAQQMVRDFNGTIPASVDDLRKLPGVGEYTAAAVASLAFGADEPALDGNLRRVLARITALPVDPRSPQGQSELTDTARHLLPPGRAGDFNQALMDLSNQVCLPKNPHCADCPLTDFCVAFQQNRQAYFPVKVKKAPVPTLIVTAGVLRRGNSVLLSKRPADGLLGGMWEFPGGKQEPGESLPECLIRELQEELGVTVKVGTDIGLFKHAYSHFKVVLHAFECEITAGEPRPLASDGLDWVAVERLGDFAMGKIDRMIAQKIGSLHND
jgi:A/G-specific adenine glycosylase